MKLPFPQLLLSGLRRPSLWVALLTFLAYYDQISLNGSFVYDDAGSIAKNPVVSQYQTVPWTEVWKVDFWGTTPLTSPQSHKSFRPFTTLTFRWNYMWGYKSDENSGVADNNKTTSTFYFHLVNLLLHTIVTAMVTEIAYHRVCSSSRNRSESSTAPNALFALLTGMLFGLHPVHVEAVTNLTSRSELLMSLFYLIPFVFYDDQKFLFLILSGVSCIASMLSKEQGITLLLALVVYRFLQDFGSLREFIQCKQKRKQFAFVIYTLCHGSITLALAYARYSINGTSRPDFIQDQNPAGFASDRFTRVFSTAYVHVLYIRDAVYPYILSPDWSGISISLIRSYNDPRILLVLLLWLFVGLIIYTFVTGASYVFPDRKFILTSLIVFSFTPFLLSSNLLVVIGLMKADRVLYLPLMGFCMVQAHIIQKVLQHFSGRWLVYALVLVQFHFYVRTLHQRNRAWSSQLALWMDAYRVNPVSFHTIYNCGYELSLMKRYREAEQVLRPIADPHVQGPSNTFVYAMVLYNLQRCDLALGYIRAALEVVHEKRKNSDGVRNTNESLNRVESNLLVAKGFCQKDISVMGKLFYEAVQVDPHNHYAIENAQKLAERLKAANMI